MRLLPVFTLLLLFATCTKTSIRPVAQEECVDVEPFTSWTFEELYHTQYPLHVKLDLNPVNSNQISLVTFDSMSNPKARIYDSELNKITELPALGASSAPRWSPDGRHLLFFKPVYNSSGNPRGYSIFTYSIADGTLKQISADHLDFHPSWNADGTKITFLRNLSPFTRIITDLDGNILSTIYPTVSNAGSWFTDSLALRKDHEGMYISNLYTSVTDTLLMTDASGRTGNGADWVNDQQLMYVNTEGIHTYDLLTGISTPVRKTCLSMSYSLIGVNEADNKVVLRGTEYVRQDSIGGVKDIGIYTMSLDGHHIERLNIPN